MRVRTGDRERGRVRDRARPVRDLARVVAVVRGRHIVDGQDVGEDGVVVGLDAAAAAGLRPRDVQRLIALAAGAHQLGAHSLRDVVLELERRDSRRH